ncbi:hypothetical protein TNCV_5105481 [Trichonephila clavipes]|nr:hypothetical protein TNCV_5105481 [Trichonephila clavipes]
MAQNIGIRSPGIAIPTRGVLAKRLRWQSSLQRAYVPKILQQKCLVRFASKSRCSQTFLPHRPFAMFFGLGYTRAFGNGPRNFEPWSSDMDDTCPGTPSPNYHTTPTGGRFSSRQI